MRATYEARDGVLYASITDTFSQADAKQNRDTLVRMMQETGLRRGLIDLSAAKVTQNTFDIYELNTKLDDIVPKSVRFAFVYSSETMSRELAEFAENVLVNAGYDARVCTDYDEALRWVKGED